MTTDDPRPTQPTATILAEDLSLSNEEGMSWFIYRPGQTPDTILADLYTYDGKIDKTFKIHIAVEDN